MKKLLVIIASLLFFLAALTLYLNRVVFPRLIKNIAVQRMEEALKRRVEIGSIHFNWFRGFVIDRIKIHEKSPQEGVFVQADQVSFGILVFPGFKHFRISIPYINVRSPSVHLARTGVDTWNFSDLLPASTPPAAMPSPTGAKAVHGPALEIAWGGVTISNGKCLVDDISTPAQWSEYFDNINLKLSLSYKGINYDFTAAIPQRGGVVGATVYYHPLTKDVEAHVHLKNIDMASYLSLVYIPNFHLDSGLLKTIDLKIKHTPTMTSAQGDILMQHLDITGHQQHFKGDIELRGLEAQYQNGAVEARGQLALNNIRSSVPGLTVGGSAQASVNNFEFNPRGLAFSGSLHAQGMEVVLKDDRVTAKELAFDNINVKKDKNGVQSVGSVSAQGLSVLWQDQRLQGNISLKSATMRMKDGNDIRLHGQLAADRLFLHAGGRDFSSRHLSLENAHVAILNQKNIVLKTGLSIEAMSLKLADDLSVSGTIETNRFLADLVNGSLKVSTTLDISKGKLDLGGRKTIEGDPQLELNLRMPLNKPEQLTYKGSITLSDGVVRGLSPLAYLDNIQLDADFKNDEATINALNINALDTNVRVSGMVHDFKRPSLDITADADGLNLAKAKEIFPQSIDQYGLAIDGTANLKVKFKGLAADPLGADILAVAEVQNAAISSSKLHQHLKNITATFEATPHSLKVRDFTAVYQGRKYSLSGSLEDFKHPRVAFNLAGDETRLNGNVEKTGSTLTIHSLKGKYLNINFDGKGTVELGAPVPLADIDANLNLSLEDLLKALPPAQKKALLPLNPTGLVNLAASFRGWPADLKNARLHALITSPVVRLMGYRLTNLKIDANLKNDGIKNSTLDASLYDGAVHAVGSLDLKAKGMPYELALNIAGTDLRQLKMDSPLKMQEINGKFFLTSLAHGTVADFKNTLSASGSLAIREGYLAEFNLFKGLLGVLNEALRLGQVMITDVDGNFTIENQKINTDDLRLRGPTVVLLTKGWVNFDQLCDLDVTVDLSAGVVPAMAHDVLNSINIRVYDKIADPKFKRKISMPQVINSLIKDLLPQ